MQDQISIVLYTHWPEWAVTDYFGGIKAFKVHQTLDLKSN